MKLPMYELREKEAFMLEIKERKLPNGEKEESSSLFREEGSVGGFAVKKQERVKSSRSRRKEGRNPVS